MPAINKPLKEYHGIIPAFYTVLVDMSENSKSVVTTDPNYLNNPIGLVPLKNFIKNKSGIAGVPSTMNGLPTSINRDEWYTAPLLQNLWFLADLTNYGAASSIVRGFVVSPGYKVDLESLYFYSASNPPLWTPSGLDLYDIENKGDISINGLVGPAYVTSPADDYREYFAVRIIPE